MLCQLHLSKAGEEKDYQNKGNSKNYVEEDFVREACD